MSLIRNATRKIKVLLKHEIPFLMRDSGLLPGERCYARFIILGRSRVGSNWLNSLLDANPAIVSYSEIFGNDYSIGWGRGGMPSGARMIRLMNDDPVGFLGQKVFRTFPPKTQAVGFKLFYYHARDEKRKALWDHLVDDKNLKVIHLRRENMLKTQVSVARARITDQWVSTNSPKKECGAIRMDPQECIRVFEQTRQWEQEARESFASHNFMEVTYEEMVRDKTTVVNGVYEFLGVPPIQVPESKLRKQNRHGLRDSIENYEEVAEALSGTEWSVFLGE